MNTQTNYTESEAIKIAKSLLTEGFTFALMHKKDAEDFIWSYLFDNGLQYKVPIDYVDEFGNQKSALVYQDK